MKIRNGFVSNSSSSSFVIKIESLNKTQKCLVKNYITKVKKSDLEWKQYVGDWWMEEVGDEFRFSTCMDNFDLISFFREAGIEVEKIERDA